MMCSIEMEVKKAQTGNKQMEVDIFLSLQQRVAFYEIKQRECRQCKTFGILI